MMKIGVVGGTFDPVHNGHLAIAREVRARLSLTRILFVPAGQPWLKASRVISAAEHRLEMVRLAIAGCSYCELSTVEIDRPGPSYAVDTIEELGRRLGPGDELFFVLGWDSLAELPQWREPRRLVRLCRLVVIPRPGYPPPDLDLLKEAVPGLSHRVTLLDGSEIDISASLVRRRVARGASIGHLVPGPVERYIREHGLYLPG